ncbi:hypothetical protein EYR40_002401 [Pleurotus pulmonarius]|nr:hypothetical protein EYR40_002401 [Pleurotus pulmonarius]
MASLARPARNVVVGIRKEDPARIWERRCPLTPTHIYNLRRKDVKVFVERCQRRIWSEKELVEAGAKIVPSLEDADIVLGIKEPPVETVLTRPPSNSPRTHVMFSHTAKGQPYNTGLLAKFLPKYNLKDDLNGIMSRAPRLIDYELIKDEESDKRVVGFGWFAGVAGVLESLSSMAHSHLEMGIASPFLYTPRPHTQSSLSALRASLKQIGETIKEKGTPPALGPVVIGLTGNGNVSQGCLSMLRELPIQYVQPKDLPRLVSDTKTPLDRIYLVHALPHHYISRLDGAPYDREDYYRAPQSYRSDFAEKIAPYLTLLLNGAGWQSSFPRLMTTKQLEAALFRASAIGGARLLNIGDISCDLGGGLEFMTRSSTISEPFYKLQVNTSLPAVQIMSVDILPTTIPLDASEHFAEAFKPYLNALIEQYQQFPHNSHKWPDSDDKYMKALDRATIAMNGELTSPHLWLQDNVTKWKAENPSEAQKLADDASSIFLMSLFKGNGNNRQHETKAAERQQVYKPSSVGDAASADVAEANRGYVGGKKKRMLMLGSGMVAGPAVDEIARRPDVELLIASNSLREVEKLTEHHLNVKYRLIDMKDLSTVSDLISESDVVISLLPASLHPKAAELCIKHKKHLVTASYISSDMALLDKSAIDADVLLLNEIGLDPGIDHCSAISLIERLKSQGKNIASFISFCGGLPAPDVPHVPLRYKFSWSPRGVLTAALNSAQYRLNDTTYNITGDNLLKTYFPDVPITDKFDLEGIANRDSLTYVNTYNLEDQPIRTILRGTLRYPGFSKLMDSFKSLGILETNKTMYLERWSSLVPQAISIKLGVKFGTLDVPGAIKTLVGESQARELFNALRWLGLLPSIDASAPMQSFPPMPREKLAPIDLFSILLAHKLKYKSSEKDMVLMSHEIIASPKVPGAKPEIHTSNLMVLGDDRASAMARTVGLPVAFAALRVIDDQVAVRGVVGPKHESIYRPILSELERVGLGMQESMRFEEVGGQPPIERVLVPGAF